MDNDSRLLEILLSDLGDADRLEAILDLHWPTPPEVEESTMELRVLIQPHAQRRLKLDELMKVPVTSWKEAADRWLAIRGQFGLRMYDVEWVRVYEKTNPVATVSEGGGIWSYEDQDLPFMDSECRCLYDPLGIHT